MKLFNSPCKGDKNAFLLERLPKTSKGDLRAWDAADELLLEHVCNEVLTINKKLASPILIINDAFGALAVGLHQSKIHSWSDSATSHFATENNFKINQLSLSHYHAIPSTDKLTVQYDLVLIKIPKTLALLEDLLCRLKSNIHSDTLIIASAMTKHIHTSTLKQFEKIIGVTKTSRATKKARLIFATNDDSLTHSSPYPKDFQDQQFDLNLNNHANVFSKDHLDIGTRFLLEQLKNCPPSNHIIDLACGNGALGIVAQRLQPKAQLSFVDESYMAIASAKENVGSASEKNNSEFYISDSLNQVDFESNSVKPDLILCNPPFHQAHSMGDHIAWQMFKQSRDVLQNNGELWVVGNRHLAYHIKMKKLFGNCRNVAGNKKFVVLAAVKGTSD